MTHPANPMADDYRTQLHALLAQASDYAAALDEIARDDPRRLVDVACQLTAWHTDLVAVLLRIVGAPLADRNVALADALAVTAEAASKPEPISGWEYAARLFEQPPSQDEA